METGYPLCNYFLRVNVLHKEGNTVAILGRMSETTVKATEFHFRRPTLVENNFITNN